MRKGLLRQLEILEAKRPEMVPGGIIWKEYLTIEQQRTLTANDRVVEDWYLGFDDCILRIKPRITTDPTDVGLNYVGTNRELNDFTIDPSRIERHRKGDLIWVERHSGTARVEPKPDLSRYSSVNLTPDPPVEDLDDDFDEPE
jgi:hypothetical protein